MTMITLLIGAFIATAVIFWYASTSPVASDNLRAWQQKVNSDIKETVEENTSPNTAPDGAGKASVSVPEGGIPLSSLPLTDSQKSALGNVGIDVNTFVLTQPMLECGAEKIGNDRIEAIVGGAAPSFMETTQMLPCLSE